MSWGATNSCLKCPLRYIWKRDFRKPYLSCSVITHYATYSSVLLLPGEMQTPGEKQRVPLPPCAGPKSAALTKQNLLTPFIKHNWGLSHGHTGEGRLGLVALIPPSVAHLLLGDSWRVTAAITKVASGGATPLLNPNDLLLLTDFPVGSTWQQAGILNQDSTTRSRIRLGK